jgi:hypothetical protein
MEFLGKEGEDTLGGTILDDVANTRNVIVNSGETELGEPKRKMMSVRRFQLISESKGLP